MKQALQIDPVEVIALAAEFAIDLGQAIVAQGGQAFGMSERLEHLTDSLA
jgi:hypothetical protein